MSTMDQIWENTDTGGNTEFAEEVTPDPGTYEVTVSEGKYFTSQKGEQVLVVTYRKDDGKSWSDVRVLTRNGEPQEGRIKAAKVMLSQLGIGNATPSSLPSALGTVIGKRYAVEVVAQDNINQVTGKPYIKTNVTGVVQGKAPAPAAAPAAEQEPAWDAGSSDAVPF